MSDYLTLPAIAMAIFRTHYMKHKIPILTGHIERCVRKAYYGGMSLVFKPRIERGYYYDMNSEYPTAMLKDMPIGKPYYVLNPNIKDFFGFCEAIIEVPETMYIPILGIRVSTRVIYPTGRFTG